jgi:hypothetical protein
MKLFHQTYLLLIGAFIFGCTQPDSSTVNQGGGASETVARVIIIDTVVSINLESTTEDNFKCSIFSKTYHPVADTGFTDSIILSGKNPAALLSHFHSGTYNILISSADSRKAVLFTNVTLSIGGHDTIVDSLRVTSSITGNLFTNNNNQKSVPTDQWFAFVRGTRYAAAVDSSGVFKLEKLAAGELNLIFESPSYRSWSTISRTVIVVPEKDINGLEVEIP